MERNIWDRIDNLDDYFISFLLYKEGKPIRTIARIRNESVRKIEHDIIKAKAFIRRDKADDKDFLLDIMSLSKDDRIEEIDSLSKKKRELLIDEIYRRYTSFKNEEDRMILIWLIGELDSDKLLYFLRMELKSNRFNQKRLACSALGKLKRPSTRSWLHYMIDDDNGQVRQYAIKALKDIGDRETIDLLKARRLVEDKRYVIDAIDETLESIIARLGWRDKNGKRIQDS